MKECPWIRKPLIIGIGNADRGDDAAGLHVARELEADSRARVLEVTGEGVALMDAWRGAGTVFLIDAVRSSDGLPGAIYRLDARSTKIPAQLQFDSSHALGVGAAIELARALESLPPQIILYGIEAANFGFGAPLTEAVKIAIQQVAIQIRAELSGMQPLP